MYASHAMRDVIQTSGIFTWPVEQNDFLRRWECSGC